MSADLDMHCEDIGAVLSPTDPEDARHVRAREARHAKPQAWAPAKVVTQAKCQAYSAGCTNLVDVTDEALGMIATFDAILSRRGDESGRREPLDLNACFACDSCRSKRAAALEQQSAQRSKKISESVRYLKVVNESALAEADENIKAGRVGALEPMRTGDAARECAKRMLYLAKVMGSGYVTELLGAIRDSRNAPGKSRPRKEDL